LSYTTFSYSDMVVNASSIGPCDTVLVTVDVANTGTVAGDEVVQLYVKTPTASVPAPLVRLADFERVHIAAGGKTTVSLLLTPKYHSVVHDAGKDAFWTPSIVVEAGTISLHVGGGQPEFTSGVRGSSLHIEHEGKLTTQYTC
jgi:beta-glucosidase